MEEVRYVSAFSELHLNMLQMYFMFHCIPTTNIQRFFSISTTDYSLLTYHQLIQLDLTNMDLCTQWLKCLHSILCNLTLIICIYQFLI